MSPTKIEKLTDTQIARFAEFRDRWLKIGLSTEPADRPAAEAAIIESYRAAGLDAPQRIVWCGSPLSQGLTRAIILDKKMIADIGKAVGDSVGDSVWDSVRASVEDSVEASVWDSVVDSVGASVRASVWASVWASVRASVWDSVWDSVEDSVGDSVGDSVYGQHEAGWLSFYSYFREVCGLTTQTDSLRGLTSQAQAAGWFLPHAKICWVSERHNILRQDERGRLHDLSEPACAYPDGWAIYAVHGVRVPGWIIETPSEITPTKIDAEKNAEIRRVMMTKFGEAKYLEQSGAVEVSRDLRGVLYRKDIVGDEPLVMVRVENSTPETDGSAKPFWLRVPPGCKTAAEAVAWTFGVETHKYEPEVES